MKCRAKKLLSRTLFMISICGYLFFLVTYILRVVTPMAKVNVYLDQHMLMWGITIALLMFVPWIIGLLLRGKSNG